MARSLYAQLHTRFGPQTIDGVSRRDALKACAAAAATLWLADRSLAGIGSPRQPELPKPDLSRNTPNRVIVVGAGFAGLSCAMELMDLGYDVLVLEGRGRVGGRVQSLADFVDGAIVEGGAEFIGANHPTWLGLARLLRLQLLEVDALPEHAGRPPVYIGGKLLNEQEARGLYEEMGAAMDRLTKLAEPIDARKPWESPGAAELDRLTVASWIRADSASELCKAALNLQFEADNGVPTAWQSLLAMLAMIKGGGLADFWTRSEIFKCIGGNQELARRMQLRLTSERVKFATPVASIDTTADLATVTDTGGNRFQAHDVVLTVAPAAWDAIEFTPCLPPGLRVQTGRNIKYLSAVKGDFWTSQGLSPETISEGEVTLTWEATAGQAHVHQPVLTAFAGGAMADASLRVEPEQRIAGFRAALERLYPGYGEAVTDTRYMGWPHDRWSRCSYSFPAPGELGACGRVVRDGIGRLHFAGEYACPGFVGYMEGALDSGVRIARHLAARDGKAPPPSPTTKNTGQ